MGNRLTKIYTRTGDTGTTGLGDGRRIEKNSDRIEAIGAVDELNCAIGMTLVPEIRPTIRDTLSEVQHKLFDLGGELSMPGYEAVHAADVTELERQLDDYNAELPALKEFILPGGGPAAAACHLARAICRRAERRFVTLAQNTDANESCNPQAAMYLNRLSDLLFVLCRILARDEGGSEVMWRHDRKRRQDPANPPDPDNQ